jgi:hypothetical protein
VTGRLFFPKNQGFPHRKICILHFIVPLHTLTFAAKINPFTYMANVGKVKQIIGAVVDVQFEGKLPEIYNALELKKENGDTLLI